MILPFKPSNRASWAGVQPISELMAKALANESLISLAAGFVDPTTLPVQEAGQALEEIFKDPEFARAALQYGTNQGLDQLRDQIRQRTEAQDGLGGIELDQIVLTAGSNQLLHLVAESILDAGDIVLCASPTYLVFLGTLQNIGVRAIGVEADELGMSPDALEKELEQLEQNGDLPRVKAIYLVSYSDNPAGTTLPKDRRQAIVELAKRWSRQTTIHVLDDCAYRELRYEGDDIPGMRIFDEDGSTVVTAGTFSKSFSPGVRVGWGVLPKHLIGPVCSQKANIDFGSPNINQYLVSQVIQLGLYEQHIDQIRLEYQNKMSAMLDALDESFGELTGVSWIRPKGGLYVWLTLPESILTGPDGKLFDIAVENGVLYVPGQYCFPPEGEPVQGNTIRLSFGNQTPEGIKQGVACLARSVRSLI